MEFDYDKFILAASIYNYAARVVLYPGDSQNIDYCRTKAESALNTCRRDGLKWIVKSTPCKSKKLAGKWAVTVETYPGSEYGFNLDHDTAHKIYTILLAMWKAYIHNAEINEIVTL